MKLLKLWLKEKRLIIIESPLLHMKHEIFMQSYGVKMCIRNIANAEGIRCN